MTFWHAELDLDPADVGDERGEEGTAAMTAEPMATPLVMALVVLPTASRSAMIWRALASLRRMPCQAISPMPLALSEMGPKESMATLLPVWRQHADADHGHAVEDVDVLPAVL